MRSRCRALFKATEAQQCARALGLGPEFKLCSSPQMLQFSSLLRGPSEFVPRTPELATLAHCPAAPAVKPRLHGANLLQQHERFCTRVEAAKVAPVTRSSPAEAPQSSSSTAAPQAEASEANKQTPITKVPGVGLRNAVRLKAKGFETVEALQQVFVEEHKQEKEQLIKYLQADVGIRQRRYCSSIANFLAGLNAAEQTEQRPKPRQRLTLCVEGNISAGKSTFLQALAADSVELQDRLPLSVVQEPVAKWQGSSDGGPNLLQLFYADPVRYAYTFQNYVFMTRVLQEKDSNKLPDPLRLMERSVFSDRMVFVKAIHEAHWMTDMELSVYDSWFDPLLSILPSLIPDGFIYLRATPQTCLKRLQVRARSEEGQVDLGYLENLHEKHENWLFPPQRHNDGSWGNLGEPDIIKDKVGLLKANRHHSLHPMIENVPALILEVDDHMDLANDPAAKSHIKAQVSAYYDFLHKRKEESGGLITPAFANTSPSIHLPSDRQRLEQLVNSGRMTSSLLDAAGMGSPSTSLMTARC